MIKKGHPCVAKDVNDAALNTYPEYVNIFNKIVKGSEFIQGGDQGMVSVAFVSIGGLPVRSGTATFGGSSYTADPGVFPFIYNDSTTGYFSVGDKVTAPDFWVLLTATSNAGPSDLDTQLNAQRDAIPNVIKLSTFRTTFTKSSGSGPNFYGEMRFAAKKI